MERWTSIKSKTSAGSSVVWMRKSWLWICALCSSAVSCCHMKCTVAQNYSDLTENSNKSLHSKFQFVQLESYLSKSLHSKSLHSKFHSKSLHSKSHRKCNDSIHLSERYKQTWELMLQRGGQTPQKEQHEFKIENLE